LKEKKHIIFLTHYFPPEVNAPANRTFEHCRQWIKDVDITVITNFPNHPDGKIFPGYKNKFVQKEKVEGINVIRLWTFITPNEGFILRTLNYIIYMLISVIYITLSNIKFDLVIATTPQFFCGLAGKYISIIRRKPFILELRDLWPESIIAVGALRNKTIIKILERIELNLYRSASAIISVTRSFKENLVSKGIDKEKIHIFFNGVSFDIFKDEKQISNKEINDFVNSGFIIGYIGTIGMAHSIGTLVSCADLLKETDIKFLIVGSGAEREKHENTIREKNLQNIKIFPIQPKDQIPSIINKCNLFCVHLKDQRLFETVIPSKIFEGMIMKKAILIGVNGESRKIIEDANCGIYFKPEDHNDLAEKIKYLKDNENLLNEYGHNGYEYVQKIFDRKKIAKDYLDTITKILK